MTRHERETAIAITIDTWSPNGRVALQDTSQNLLSMCLDSPRVRLQHALRKQLDMEEVKKIGSMGWGFAEDFKIGNVEAKFPQQIDYGIGNQDE